MDFDELRIEFEKKIDSYDSLGKNVAESLRTLLALEEIKNLSIYYRVKDTDSFLEKIERKSYQKPLEETEDICGIRIICYYKKDITRIEKLVKKEFRIHESINKEENLEYDQFGYRSHHLIASINKDWEKTPNFRGLSKLKFELQIRTILMHAWAEIEHNLAYKSESQTPKQFRRKLSRISAKLEEADEQFEELKNESEKYKRYLINEAKNNRLVIKSNTELNIDSLEVFMDFKLPNRSKHIGAIERLLTKMTDNNISLLELSNAWNKVAPKFEELEREYMDSPTQRWTQAGIAEFVLGLTNKKFRALKSVTEQRKMEKINEKYFA